MNRIIVGTVGIFLLTAAPAFSESSTQVSNSEPQVKTYEGIPYVSGGFGIEERNTLRSMGKEDNLQLSFALQNKDYLGGAKVLIKDSNGKDVLEAVSDGPLLFTKLPEGTYTVEATALGRTIKETAHVPSKGQTTVYFAWNESREKNANQIAAK